MRPGRPEPVCFATIAIDADIDNGVDAAWAHEGFQLVGPRNNVHGRTPARGARLRIDGNEFHIPTRKERIVKGRVACQPGEYHAPRPRRDDRWNGGVMQPNPMRKSGDVRIIGDRPTFQSVDQPPRHELLCRGWQ